MKKVFVLRLSLFVLALFPILRGEAQDVVRMSLDEAIKYAMENTNTLKNVRLGIKDAEEAILATKATGLPTVSAEAGYNFFYLVPQVAFPKSFAESQAAPYIPIYQNFDKVQKALQNSGQAVSLTYPTATGSTESPKVSFVQRNGLSAGLTVSQLVFSGSYTVALRASQLAREYAAVQVNSKETEVRNQVIEAYAPSLLITESAKTLDANIANLEKLLSDVKATVKAGFAEQLDADRLELSLANLKTERENLERQKELVLNFLKMAIGFPLEQNLELTDNINTLLASDTEGVSTAIDFNNRAEYKAILMGEKLSQVQIDLNKAGYLPTVAAFTSLTANLNSDNYFSKDKETFFLPQGLVGIKASMTIWDNNEKKHKIQRAKIALEQLRLQKSDFERLVTMQVLNARIALQNAQTRLNSQQKNLTLAEKIYNTTRIKYKEGVGSSLEISTSEQQLYQAQQNVRQAQYDLLIAQQALRKALGK